MTPCLGSRLDQRHKPSVTRQLPRSQGSCWQVLAGRAPCERFLERLPSRDPVLLLPQDPAVAEMLADQLRGPAWRGLTLQAAWLGPEDRQSCWRAYSDPRHNGNLAPEALLLQHPNLKLLDSSLRMRVRLDGVLRRWVEADPQLQLIVRSAPGRLHLFGPDPLELLSGCSAWLQRFLQIRWTPLGWSSAPQRQALHAHLREAGFEAVAMIGSDPVWQIDRQAWLEEQRVWLEERLDQMTRQLAEADCQRLELEQERDRLRFDNNILRSTLRSNLTAPSPAGDAELT